MNKKETRSEFRNGIFERDHYACAMCGHRPKDVSELDAHHITSRDLMPNGGYCKANGITLCTDRCTEPCPNCHERAEHYHKYGVPFPGYSPADLYAKIGSSYNEAVSASLALELTLENAQQIVNFWERVDQVTRREDSIVEVMGERNATTWEMACEELNESDPHVLRYGKGRFNGTNR